MNRPQAEVSRSGVAAGLAAIYLLWGSTYLAIRFAVETIPPFLMAGTRHLMAGVILFGFAWGKRREKLAWRHWRSALIVGGLLLFGGNGLVSWAEQKVPSGIAALIVASVPLWMVLMHGVQERRRPARAVLAGVTLGLAGLGLLVLPGFFGAAGRIDPEGVGILIVATLAWSAGSLYSRRAPLPSSTLLGISMEMLCGGAILWIVGLASGQGAQLHWADLTTRSVESLLYLVVFGSLIGFSTYIWLLKVATPARVSTYAFVNPVVAVFLGWAFAGEIVTLRMVLAGVIVISAVALILRFGSAVEGRT